MLLRFVLKDNPGQSKAAREFMAGLSSREPGYISAIVLCEFSWVLARSYRRTRAEIAHTVAALLTMPVLHVECAEVVQQALEHYVTSSADFGDCCIAALGASAGCSHTVTFDKAAARLPDMRILDERD